MIGFSRHLTLLRHTLVYCVARRSATCYTVYYATFQERDQLCITSSFNLMPTYSFPRPSSRARSASIHFIDLTAASAAVSRARLLFLLVKHGNGAAAALLRAYDKLFPGETQRHFQSPAIRRMTE